jgi:hypothetical protein
MPIVYGTVGAPSNTSAADSSNQPVLQGKAGEFIVAELHGIWYTAGYRGRAFHGASAIAGVVLPRETTTAATFMLFNPSGSGVNLELISFDVAELTTTGVIGTVLLAAGSNPAPSSTTAITATVMPTLIGGSSTPKAALYSAATITAMTTWWPIGQITTTTTGTYQITPYVFNGRIAVAPGAGVQACSNPVQTNSWVPAFDWAEWPV